MEKTRTEFELSSIETINLNDEQIQSLTSGFNHVFNPTNSLPRPPKQDKDLARYMKSSGYQRIMPEQLEKPYFGKRLRVFMPGFDHKERLGSKTGNHIIGLARTFESSRPHYYGEVYFGNKKKPERYYYIFVPHEARLSVAEEVAGQTEMLLATPSSPGDITFGDDEILLSWMREAYEARVKNNRFSPGMRGGLDFVMPIFR